MSKETLGREIGQAIGRLWKSWKIGFPILLVVALAFLVSFFVAGIAVMLYDEIKGHPGERHFGDYVTFGLILLPYWLGKLREEGIFAR